MFRNVKGCTCKMDLDTLECPICIEPFSPPIYQCQNGHPLCSACHVKISRCPSCSEPVGNTRNLLAEEILESLQVRCKNFSRGCEKMMKYSTREEHMKNSCGYRYVPCPIPGCLYVNYKQPLVQHLKTHHGLRTVPLEDRYTETGEGHREARILISAPSDEVQSHFVLVETAEELLEIGAEKIQMLLHREAIENLGHMFFCTTFGHCSVEYDLKVTSDVSRELPYTMMANASARDILNGEQWRTNALMFYTGGCESGMLVTLSITA